MLPQQKKPTKPLNRPATIAIYTVRMKPFNRLLYLQCFYQLALLALACRKQTYQLAFVEYSLKPCTYPGGPQPPFFLLSLCFCKHVDTCLFFFVSPSCCYELLICEIFSRRGKWCYSLLIRQILWLPKSILFVSDIPVICNLLLLRGGGELAHW